MAKKKPDEKTGRFEIRGGRDARTGRFATVTVERIPKGIVKKTIDAKREGVSFSYAVSAEAPTRIREPKLAQPVHGEFDIDAFADELLETDSVILDILAK